VARVTVIHSGKATTAKGVNREQANEAARQVVEEGANLALHGPDGPYEIRNSDITHIVVDED
jgi:hypothetical protein